MAYLQLERKTPAQQRQRYHISRQLRWHRFMIQASYDGMCCGIACDETRASLRCLARLEEFTERLAVLRCGLRAMWTQKGKEEE